MENEIIKPWVARYKDSYGVEVETVGVDIVNHRVIFMRSGYPHPCAQPRERWGRKFRKVAP
ncbi:DUF4222 domain-containing protein [Pantoea dispersa]|uniref:DUF4222 domain-containing protein n=1 Tax=Pantoea dispersa TaxID=59814 RepID=UPI0039BDB0FF